MKSFKEYMTEHHKLGPLYKAFNMLQGEVFLTLYNKMYGVDDKSKSNKLSRIITTTPAARIFGDEMSHEIPDRIIIDHDKRHVNILADELLKRIKK